MVSRAQRRRLTLADVLPEGRRWAVVEADALVVLATLPAACVDHVITDPPYDDRTSEGARSAKDLAERRVDFDGIAPAAVVPRLLRVTRRWCVAFCALEQLGAYQAASGASWVRSGTWHRTNPAPQFTGDRPGQTDEGVAVMHRPGKKRWSDGGHGAWWHGPIAAQQDRLGPPTPKPMWLMLEMLRQFTDPGDLILDPFAGGGTTGAAALRLGRRVILVERDPRWAELCRERMRAEEATTTVEAQRSGQRALFGEAS